MAFVHNVLDKLSLVILNGLARLGLGAGGGDKPRRQGAGTSGTLISLQQHTLNAMVLEHQGRGETAGP